MKIIMLNHVLDTECKKKCILMEKIDRDSTKAKIKVHQNVLSEILLLHLGIGKIGD